jgi:acetate kinase
MTVGAGAGKPQALTRLTAGDHRAAVSFLLDWLESQPIFSSVRAVGHRLVQGMKHFEPARVTPKLLTELHRITAYDPITFPGRSH